MTITRARTIVLWVLTAEIVVLAATGVLLYFFYRPDAASAWSDISASLSREITLGGVLRQTHRWVAWLAVPTAIVAAALLMVRARATEPVPRGIAIGGAIVVAVVAASFTGYLLPWDQLALWEVTVGTNLRGYSVLRGDDVRFVLIGGTEIAPSTVLKWLLLHGVVLGGAVIGLLVLAWRRTRRGALAPPPQIDTPPVEVPAGV